MLCWKGQIRCIRFNNRLADITQKSAYQIEVVFIFRFGRLRALLLNAVLIENLRQFGRRR
ncbi:Uncharacterised protein [Vibrio cholerae]|nr:Uncharacterised protein [Vibrio cholerae]